jgi:glycosyltransferase involved in cell wall biosynthesis
MPCVSIYLPTRNRADRLVEAIRSVQQQDHADFELLVVDDASSDTTPERVAALMRADARIKYLRLATPHGAARARNAAIRVAQGAWITGIDDDDLMLPAHVSGLLAAYRDEDALVCAGFYQERDGWRRPIVHRAEHIALDALLHYNWVGSQALMATERVRAVGGFDEHFVACQDWDLWTRLVARFGPARRSRAVSYVSREDVSTGRITGSSQAAIGTAQYAHKHAVCLTNAHRRSHQLLARIAAKESLSLWSLATHIVGGQRSLALRYALGRVPPLRWLSLWWRRHRYPAASG